MSSRGAASTGKSSELSYLASNDFGVLPSSSRTFAVSSSLSSGSVNTERGEDRVFESGLGEGMSVPGRLVVLSGLPLFEIQVLMQVISSQKRHSPVPVVRCSIQLLEGSLSCPGLPLFELLVLMMVMSSPRRQSPVPAVHCSRQLTKCDWNLSWLPLLDVSQYLGLHYACARFPIQWRRTSYFQ